MNDTRRGVLFIAPSAYVLGGLATWLDYLLPGLRARGWDAVLGLCTGLLHRTEDYLQAHDVGPALEIENRTGSREGRLRALSTALRQYRPAVAVSVNIPDLFVAVARARRQGVSAAPKLVASIHGLEPDLYGDLAKYRAALDGVVCSNRLAVALARAYSGIESSRVHYGPYGVALGMPLRERRTSAEPLRVLFCGRLEQAQKRVRDVPLIMSALVSRGVDCTMTFAGAGPERAALEGDVRDQGLRNQVRFVGALWGGDLENAYCEHDVLLITSAWETGPIVAWEAMARGACIVTSRYLGSGLEKALRHEQNCLMFDIGDVSGAADVLARLTDHDLRVRLAGNAGATVRDRFSRDISVSIWSDTLERITRQAPLSAPNLPTKSPVSGRLDRLLGTQRAESVRGLLGIRFRHSDPGGEWPHTHGVASTSDTKFWEQARRLDDCCDDCGSDVRM